MIKVYQNIRQAKNTEEKLLAVLIDPDKMLIENLSSFIDKVNRSIITHIFVGGSTVKENMMPEFVSEIKTHTELPVVIFPGDESQITDVADGLLFLSLISGRNPEYLIEKQIKAVSKLRETDLEIIPTGYILIDSGNETSVQRVSGTQALSQNNTQHILDTAKAGELLGMKLIYLEAGSGALNRVNNKIISKVKKDLAIPVIVGGGIKNKKQLMETYQSGADLVVIGTAFEDDESFFNDLL